MKNKSIVICLFILATILPQVTLAIDLPPIKAGLWEIKSVEGSHDSGVKQYCMNSSTMHKMLSAAQKAAGSQCGELSISKSGDTYLSKLDCKFMGSNMITESIVTGDFSTYYTVSTDTKIVPPFMGQGGSTSKEEARWLGECPAGMSPGDLKMADGKTINTERMMENLPDTGAMMEKIQAGQMPNPEEMQRLMNQVKEMQKQMGQ